ncbi:WXG100 family type VII secretion target [Actinacidiphila yanglinensis]|uniref:WXG100 family type VII secretion target n=1 Tax=Actinacidiphila yanglinensis TaxID=310779 RepID=A0A1H6E548_9ACTN|nr:WXG100 family type VII secretion target [Actinacidiphila yanglinensis]SEG92005.1 WXG100 family type VII secretion target [Actinacidiphila yanglinensis]
MAATDGGVTDYKGGNGVLYHATPDDLKTHAHDIASTQQTIMGEIAALRTYVVQMEDIWQGYASNTFQDLMTDWDRYANKLGEVLGEISTALVGSADTYAKAEHANHTVLAAASASLPAARLS